MPDCLQMEDGRLKYTRGAGAPDILQCATEEQFFRHMKIPYVEPRDRSELTAKRLMGRS